MKKILLSFIILFLSVNLQAQNFLYIGDNSYPASEIRYFTCTECGWNSYQEKLDKNNLSKYKTLEFQTGKSENQTFVRISIDPTGSSLVGDIMNKLDNKISIFFTNGQRIVLNTPILRVKIDKMQEIFFSLTESQALSVENNNIAKIQYGIIQRDKTLNLAEAIPYKEQ